MSLVVVHVNAVAVHLFSEAVTGAVNELSAVPCPVDDVTRRPIDLVTSQLASFSGRALHQFYPGVASGPDGSESLRVLLRHDRARKPHPGDISKDRAGRGQLAPEVQQHELTPVDGPMGGRCRLIVRVAGIFLSCHAGRGVADQAVFCEPLQHCLLDVVLRQPVSDTIANQLESAILDPVEPL